jgi:hypothetical protein
MLATCGDYQVENYIQTLWEDVSPSKGSNSVYNGGVVALSTFIGVFVVFLPSVGWGC